MCNASMKVFLNRLLSIKLLLMEKIEMKTIKIKRPKTHRKHKASIQSTYRKWLQKHLLNHQTNLEK